MLGWEMEAESDWGSQYLGWGGFFWNWGAELLDFAARLLVWFPRPIKAGTNPNPGRSVSKHPQKMLV